MYLSKLELQGFKSFAQRTVVTFDPGITAIVGPNGCGKSNIVDAVRWVIGEQRARILRSDKMENVIFNGTSKRKALGMAEVLLTIENTHGILPIEYSEVTLGRRLYRSGESEYLLNGVKCRLQDITDLFMDTGMGAGAYSVIELKMIEEILSENAQDRRRLFEEAAGITKYKLRRKQAYGKLDSTQADLIRLRDLTDEIEKRVRGLKRQAERAAKYKELSQRLEELERALAQIEYDRLTATRDALETDAARARVEIERYTTLLATEEARLEALKVKLTDQEPSLSGRRRALNAYLESVRSLESEVRLDQERLDASRRELDRLLREKEEAKERREATHAALEQCEKDLAAAAPLLEESIRLQQKAQEARDNARAVADEQRETVQALRAKERKADEARSETRSRLDRLTSRLEMLEQDHERTVAKASSADEASGEIEARRRLASRGLEEARIALDTARKAFEKAAEALEQKKTALASATEKLQLLERQRDAVAAEVGLLESLVASYEAFPDAVQFLAHTPDWRAGELQTVSDVLACDERDRFALDAALGDFASCIVVRSHDEARQAVNLLRSEQKGRATFLVLDQLKGLPSTSTTVRPEGISFQPLLDVIKVSDPAYRCLAALLLHDCYVVDTEEEAREAAAQAEPPARFFARTGDWFDSSGLLRAGSTSDATSPVIDRMGRREQLAALRLDLQKVEDTLAESQVEVDTLRKELGSIPYETCRAEVTKLERALTEAEKENERVAIEARNVAQRADELTDRIKTLEREIESGRAQIGELELAARSADENLQAIRSERALAEERFQSAEAESRLTLDRYNEATVAVVQARNRYDNLKREVDRLRQSLHELHETANSRQAQIEELRQKIAADREHHAALEEQIKTVSEDHTGLREAVESMEMALRETRSEIAEVEASLRTIRQQREQYIREENSHAVRLAEVQTRIADLVQNIEDDYQFSLHEQRVPLSDDLDEMSARQEVQELREKIRSLGGVNELALENYEEEKERLDFLVSQRNDLERAESTLLQTIKEINETAAARFLETYDLIQSNFVRIFTELFGEGATAGLEMNDPGDPLESAIEIMAKPRGKRPTTITQLSGGEKTLTAIALLFAIYLVKPSPFCILDEVDAPLDDANVERFMRLIRDFSSRTQFILVTHNKRTMEAADRMYGVTMQEQGVSSLVGVRFDEALAAVNE